MFWSRWIDRKRSDYYVRGARFVFKWRAVLQITKDDTSDLAIQENAWGLARYARSVQEDGLVPIVEPEILMDGDHSIETTSKVQEHVITEVYKACKLNGVYLEGTLLKPSMTVSGSRVPDSDAKTVAKTTVATLLRCVPSEVLVSYFYLVD